MPGRRGNPGGVGPVLRITRSPSSPLSSSAAEQAGDLRHGLDVGGHSCPEHRDPTRPGPAGRRARTRRVAWRAPWRARRRTRRRAAPPPVPRRPAHWGARRRTARGTRTSSAATRRASPTESGSATASGIPGEPPPGAEVDDRAAARSDDRLEREARRRAGPSERRPSSEAPSGPGVATTSSSQRSSTSLATAAPQSAKWRGSTTT